MATSTTTSASDIQTEPQGYVTIVCDPTRIGRNAPIRVAIARDVVPAKGVLRKGATAREPETVIEGTFFPPGSKSIPRAEYDILSETEQFQVLVKKGVFTVYLPESPEGNVKASTTLDFELTKAFDLIEASADVEWLQRSALRDDREGVSQACQERINSIQEEETNPDLSSSNEMLQ